MRAAGPEVGRYVGTRQARPDDPMFGSTFVFAFTDPRSSIGDVALGRSFLVPATEDRVTLHPEDDEAPNVERRCRCR